LLLGMRGRCCKCALLLLLLLVVELRRAWELRRLLRWLRLLLLRRLLSRGQRDAHGHGERHLLRLLQLRGTGSAQRKAQLEGNKQTEQGATHKRQA